MLERKVRPDEKSVWFAGLTILQVSSGERTGSFLRLSPSGRNSIGGR